MDIRRFAALSAVLLLGFSVANVAGADPRHKPHVSLASDAHTPVPALPSVRGHTSPAPPGSGLWHAIPVAAPHAGQFASRSPSGYWHHGWYGPQFGWWWVVSGVWFFYPVPVYPYPDPYVPSDWAAPPPPAGEAMPAAGSYWYFCPASNAYYPYVPSCPSGWQQVPAQPAGSQDAPSAATAAPPPPDGPPGG